MPTREPPLAAETPEDPNLPHRWTTEEYYAFAAAGAFDDMGRVELLDGELFFMPPPMTPHAATVRRTSRALRAALSAEYDVSVQLPIDLGHRSQPEPDVFVTRTDPQDFADHHPTPAEIVLLVEVSDSTLTKDTTRKAALYARAGIAEYCIVNVIDGQVEVFRAPGPDAAPIAVSALLPLAA